MAQLLQVKAIPITTLFGRDYANLSYRQREYVLNEAFLHWRENGFPYSNLAEDEILREFGCLLKLDAGGIFRGNLINHSTLGLRLANNFQPQMWRVRVHGRSPVERFDEDATLRSALEKATKFWPNRRCWNAQCIRSMFRILHRSRVANFRPTVAKALIERYSRTGDTVLDFSAGYGGRLLGALALNRRYLGIDPSREQIDGCRKMLRSLAVVAHGKGTLYKACAEDILPLWPSRSVDLILSSPPYYDTERYSEEPTQSYIRYPNYGIWLHEFLEVVLVNAHRLLKRHGYMVINAANVQHYAIGDDILKLGAAIFRTKPRQLKMSMPRQPAVRAGGIGGAFRWEPVWIFQKKT